VIQPDGRKADDRDSTPGGDDESARYVVGCIYCPETFDLMRAVWCGHAADLPSKICPRCGRCLCDHPMYRWSHLWHEAPARLRRHGFKMLFVLYTEWFDS